MMIDNPVALVALVVAVATFAVTCWGMRSRASAAEMRRVKDRVDECEERHRECERRLDRLTRENIRLMRQVLGLPAAAE